MFEYSWGGLERTEEQFDFISGFMAHGLPQRWLPTISHTILLNHDLELHQELTLYAYIWASL